MQNVLKIVEQCLSHLQKKIKFLSFKSSASSRKRKKDRKKERKKERKGNEKKKRNMENGNEEEQIRRMEARDNENYIYDSTGILDTPKSGLELSGLGLHG